MASKENPQILHFSNDISYAQKSIVSQKIIANKGGNISLFAFDKGEALSEHTAPFDAMVQIIEGKAKVKIDGVDYSMKTGESIVMPADIPHALEATEQFKMLLTMIKG
jgi:quercetin dioxygenase-like cupin family protein